MAMISNAIEEEIPVFLLKFPFSSPIQVSSYEISPVCCLKYRYNYFSSHFCFLVFIVFSFVLTVLMLLLAAVINISLLFLILPSNWCIYTIFNLGESSSSYISWHM